MTREEAIDCINAIHVQMFNSGNSKWTEACDMAIEALKERPHGEWIPFEWDSNYNTKIPLPKGSDSHMEEYWDEEFMCSVCGKEHHARNFCPNCGADMRKEGEAE